MTQFGWEDNSVECASVSVPLTTDSLDRLCKLAAKLDRSPTDLAREAFELGLKATECGTSLREGHSLVDVLKMHGQ